MGGAGAGPAFVTTATDVGDDQQAAEDEAQRAQQQVAAKALFHAGRPSAARGGRKAVGFVAARAGNERPPVRLAPLAAVIKDRVKMARAGVVTQPVEPPK